MGTDNQEFSINSHIADAVRHAMLIYGEGVLYDPGLIEILRDHGAFHDHNCADEIIRMVIDAGHMPALYSLINKENREIIDGVDREVCNLRYMSSFYEKDIRTVLLSLVKGMNMNLVFQSHDLDNEWTLNTEEIPNKTNFKTKLRSTQKPEYDIQSNIHIDPDDLIEPPSCPIPTRRKKTGKQEETEDAHTEIKDKQIKDKHSRKKTKVFAVIFGIALAIAIGLFAVLNVDIQKEEPKEGAMNKTIYNTPSVNSQKNEFKKILKRGMSGSQVFNLVTGLSNAEYLKMEDVTQIKGIYIYDETVERAVVHFQKDLGIRRDGVYNTDLDEILFSFWRPEYTSCRLGKRELSTSERRAGPDVDVLIDILSDACFISDTSLLPMSDKVEYTENVRKMFEKAGSSRGEEIASSQHHYYSKEIKEALMHFQSFHGINPSGELNEATLRALSDSYLRIKEKKPSSYDARPVGL